MEQTGIKLSGAQVRRILKRKKAADRWGKYSLEEPQARKKSAAFKDQLAPHLAASKAAPEGYQIWFGDERGGRLSVIRRNQWGKPGKRKPLAGQGRRGRVNGLGG